MKEKVTLKRRIREERKMDSSWGSERTGKAGLTGLEDRKARSAFRRCACSKKQENAKITTEAGQIEKSDIQIAGKKHDKADSQQSGRILSFHRKRTAQIPGQQCNIEKGGRRKEAAFYMPEIRDSAIKNMLKKCR